MTSSSPSRAAASARPVTRPSASAYAVLSPCPARCTPRSAEDVGRQSNGPSLYVLMVSLNLKRELFDTLPYIVRWCPFTLGVGVLYSITTFMREITPLLQIRQVARLMEHDMQPAKSFTLIVMTPEAQSQMWNGRLRDSRMWYTRGTPTSIQRLLCALENF